MALDAGSALAGPHLREAPIILLFYLFLHPFPYVAPRSLFARRIFPACLLHMLRQDIQEEMLQVVGWEIRCIFGPSKVPMLQVTHDVALGIAFGGR